MQGAKLDGSKEHYKYLSTLIIIEHQQQTHNRIKHHTQQQTNSGIKYIEIPIDGSIPWNNIPSSLTENQWKKIRNPEVIEKHLISRNRSHLYQVQCTLFTINPLRYLLGKDCFTHFSNSPLLGTAKLKHLSLLLLQKLYLTKLKSISYLLVTLITSTIRRRHDAKLKKRKHSPPPPLSLQLGS